MQEADTQLTRGSDKDASKKAEKPPPSPAQPSRGSATNGVAAKQNGASLNSRNASENGASSDAHRPKRCLPVPALHCWLSVIKSKTAKLNVCAVAQPWHIFDVYQCLKACDICLLFHINCLHVKFACTLCRWPGSVTDAFGDDGEDSTGALPGFEPMRTDNNDNSEGSTAAVDFRRSQPGSA